jgi:hypothetical protein
MKAKNLVFKVLWMGLEARNHSDPKGSREMRIKMMKILKL